MPFPPPRAAYLHVPFCRRRCGYCNFTVVAGHDALIGEFLRAIDLELRRLETPRPVETLFLGGGTPSHLPPAELERLLELAAAWFPLAPGGEYSVEANPEDVTPELLRRLTAAGVNRVSLGAQSFQDAKLAALEREHSGAEIERAVAAIQEAGARVSLDLIFGAPGETLADWRKDLAAALRLAPDHLSTYGLTIEPGTAYFARELRGRLAKPPEETELAMYLAAIDTLAEAGFEHYEVSNFALPGRRCRHNEGYWLGRSYFAAGPGAARYLAGRRETNHRSTFTWMRRLFAGESPVAEAEELSPEERARERLVFGLRRLEGIEVASFEAETGYRLDQLAPAALRRFVDRGLLERTADRLRLTRAGLVISDSLWPELL